MPTAQAGTRFTTTFTSGVTGISTVGYQIVDDTRAVVVPRTTVGVGEVVAGSGVWEATPLAPSTPAHYSVVWDTGQGAAGVWALDDLYVTAGPPSLTAPAGTYTTTAAIRQALAPDGDTANSTAASLDDQALQDALAEAQDEIDSRLAGRYPVPFGRANTAYPDVPPIIQMAARDFAAYNATLTFFRGQPVPQGHPAQLRYQRAEKRIEELVSGKAELAQTAAEEDAAMPALTPSSNTDVENPYDGDLFTADDFNIGPGQRGPWPFGTGTWGR